MAGFFGFFDYTKEGKGVYPDEPPKGAFAAFFAILGRKFWKLCTINIMYVIMSIPALIIAFLGAMYISSVLLPNLTMETLIKIFQDSGITLQEGVTFEEFAASQLMLLYVLVGMLLTGLSLVVVGPVHAGVTYVLRNYSREEHAFIWMDFKDHAKKNLKQSLLSSLFSLVVTLIFTVNFAFYSTTTVLGSGIIPIILKTIVVILFILWCIIQMYLYPMMVTFDLSLKQLYKNCLLFSILRLPLNLLVLLASFVILAVIPAILVFAGYSISMMIAMFWYAFLAFGLNLFMTNFFVYRALDKYMIQKLKASESLNEESDDYAAEESEDNQDSEESQDDEKGEDKDKGGLVESPSGARP